MHVCICACGMCARVRVRVCVCVRACVCARACVRACVRAYVRVLPGEGRKCTDGLLSQTNKKSFLICKTVFNSILVNIWK